jgi:hypothetical protein
MAIKQSNCQVCAFAQTATKNGRTIQTGCAVGQLDKYHQLAKRSDPNSHVNDNKILKLTEMGDVCYYIINSPCCFQRAQKWVDEQGDAPPTEPDQKREYVFKDIPFEYTLVVISNGNVKQTIRTCKSACNGTITPSMLEVVYPYKYLNDKSKEELFLALNDRLASGDIKEQYSWWKFNIRQIVNPEVNTPYAMVMDAIQTHGRFWIVVLQAGDKLEEGFMESVKRQLIGELVDMHYIGLAPESAILVHPILAGDMGFAKHAAFKYKNGNLVQEFSPEWVGNFYNIN